MAIQLTEDQVKKLEAILWLTDPLGGRGSGRTQILAMAYVQHSINYRCWVHVVNHGLKHPMADKELLERILAIVNGMGGYTVRIRNNNSSILVEPLPGTYEKAEPFTSTYNINNCPHCNTPCKDSTDILTGEGPWKYSCVNKGCMGEWDVHMDPSGILKSSNFSRPKKD